VVPSCGNAAPAALDVDDLGLNVTRQLRQALPGAVTITEQAPPLHDPAAFLNAFLATIGAFGAPLHMREAEFGRLAVKVGFLANPIPECRAEPVNRDIRVEASAERMQAAVRQPQASLGPEYRIALVGFLFASDIIQEGDGGAAERHNVPLQNLRVNRDDAPADLRTVPRNHFASRSQYRFKSVERRHATLFDPVHSLKLSDEKPQRPRFQSVRLML
jgi:hypothetical protein